MTNEIAKKEDPQVIQLAPESILQVIQSAATDPNVDIDKMERLMQMHERLVARESEAAFNLAMTATQSALRRVAADKTNPQTHSDYASYAALDRALRPIYTEHGFSLSFNTDPSVEGEFVRVLCQVSHIEGHTRNYQMDIPADGKGAKGGDVMTKTHAVGSGASYGMRYLLKMIFNVAIGFDKDDDDGNAASDLAFKSKAAKTKARGSIRKAAFESDHAETRKLWNALDTDQIAELWESYGKADRTVIEESLAETQE